MSDVYSMGIVSVIGKMPTDVRIWTWWEWETGGEREGDAWSGERERERERNVINERDKKNAINEIRCMEIIKWLMFFYPLDLLEINGLKNE